MAQPHDVAIRIGGHNIPVPATILNALPQWWQEVASACSLAQDEGTAYLAVPYGSDDQVMACDDEYDTPTGWWGRFRVTQRKSGVLELADVLTGNRYNIAALSLFLAGLLSADPDDSIEVLQIAQTLQLELLGFDPEYRAAV